jgi:hypothetical protein
VPPGLGDTVAAPPSEDTERLLELADVEAAGSKARE